MLIALPSARRRPSPSRRGSTLVVALIFATAIAITLGSYLHLAHNTLRISQRAHYHNVAMNLAETGLERGMLAISRTTDGSEGAWDGWTVSADGRDRYRTLTGFTYEGQTTGEVRVRVQDHHSHGSREVIARATLTVPGTSPIEKWVRITCGRTSPFGQGLIGRKVIISGDARFNSYDSARGDYAAALGDGSFNVNDQVFVGAARLEADSFSHGKLVLEGTVAVAGEQGLHLGSEADIGPFGTRGTSAGAVRHDFTRDYDDVAAPTAEGAIIAGITSSLTLPRATDLPSIVNGRKTYYYRITDGISLSGDDVRLLVRDVASSDDAAAAADGVDVVLIVWGNVTVSGGQAVIEVAPNHSLAIYTPDDIDIRGAGVANAGRPFQFQLWGTKPQTDPVPQQVDVTGHDGKLRGVIYAPNGDVVIKGAGGGASSALFGAIVGRDVKISGDFHYDESLRQYDQRYVYRVTRWEELASAAQRAAVAGDLAF
jgi:hypothetical protein